MENGKKVSIRLNENEVSIITSKATEANMTVSQYMRAASLNQNICSCRENAEIAAQLTRIEYFLDTLIESPIKHIIIEEVCSIWQFLK